VDALTRLSIGVSTANCLKKAADKAVSIPLGILCDSDDRVQQLIERRGVKFHATRRPDSQANDMRKSFVDSMAASRAISSARPLGSSGCSSSHLFMSQVSNIAAVFQTALVIGVTGRTLS
jgi:hypothetical protein